MPMVLDRVMDRMGAEPAPLNFDTDEHGDGKCKRVLLHNVARKYRKM